jgi:hypothetical protein
MKTEFNIVCYIGAFILSCSLASALHAQDLEKEVRGMLSDALGGSKETVAINDSNQKLQLRLDRKRCVVNGASNVIRIDGECAELLVNGTGNKIRIEKVDEIRIVGANNLVRVEHSKPENIRILGAGSSVVQSEKDR